MRHHILFAALGQARPAAPTGSIRNDGKVKLICRSAGTGSGHAFAIGGVIRADKAAAVDAQVRHQAVASRHDDLHRPHLGSACAAVEESVASP
jgi:hypothetical protein